MLQMMGDQGTALSSLQQEVLPKVSIFMNKYHLAHLHINSVITKQFQYFQTSLKPLKLDPPTFCFPSLLMASKLSRAKDTTRKYFSTI